MLEAQTRICHLVKDLKLSEVGSVKAAVHRTPEKSEKTLKMEICTLKVLVQLFKNVCSPFCSFGGMGD